MAINYKNVGDSLDASEWNAIFNAADALLTNWTGGVSQFGPTYDRCFFFFDPRNPPANLHPVASAGNWLGRYTSTLFLRSYDDSSITSLISGLSITTTSTPFGVIKLAQPTASAWKAAVYPGASQPAGNPPTYWLDVSLQVVTRNGLAVTFQDATTAEHAQPYKPIDVVICGNVSWDSSWTKYSMVRVHNFSTTASSVFGTAIPPLGCRCFRNTPGGWVACGNYFHTMQSGDGRFLGYLESTNNVSASILNPGMVADTLYNALLASGALNYQPMSSGYSGALRSYDPVKFWSLASLYSSLFPTASSGSMIGDLIVHQGKFLVAYKNGSGTLQLGPTQYRSVSTTIPLFVYSLTPLSSPTLLLIGSGIIAGQTWYYYSSLFVFQDANGINVSGVTNIVVKDSGGNVIAANGTGYVNWAHAVGAGMETLELLPGNNYNLPGGGMSGPFQTSDPNQTNVGDTVTVSFNYPSPTAVAAINFEGFASLGGKLTAAGFGTRSASIAASYPIPAYTTTEFYAPDAYYWDIVDLSCTLMTFLRGTPGASIGENQSGSPKSLVLPLGTFSRPQRLVQTNVSSDPAGNGNPAQYVYNAGNTWDSTDTDATKGFLPTNTISDLESWINEGNGLVSSASGFAVVMTPFGPYITWQDAFPINSNFSLAFSNFVGALTTGLTVAGSTVNIGRALRLADGWSSPVFPKVSPVGATNAGGGVLVENNNLGETNTEMSAMFWHFPRSDRRFSYGRWFTGDGTWRPTGPTQLSNAVKVFYETSPISQDSLLPPATWFTKTGISRMGHFCFAADIWLKFWAWFNQTTVTWPTGPSTSATYNYAGLSASAYSSDFDAFRNSGWTDAPTADVAPSRLPCQVEHYNLLASLVNAVPVTPKKESLGYIYGTSVFTLNFAAAHIKIIAGGSGYVIGDSVGNNLQVSSVDSNGSVLTVSQSGSVVVISYEVINAPRRPFYGTGSGSGLLYDTNSGTSSIAGFIPAYNPMAVNWNVTNAPFSAPVFPKKSFFGWWGSDYFDPVADYFTMLGVTVQKTLPDAIANLQANWFYSMTSGGYPVFQPGPLVNLPDGTYFNSDDNGGAVGLRFAPQYRWISIDDARTLYATLGMPLVIQQTLVPAKYLIESVGVISSTDTTVEGPYLHCTPAGFNSSFDSWLAGHEYQASSNPTGAPVPYGHFNHFSGFSGIASVIFRNGFVSDAGGEWCFAGISGSVIRRTLTPLYDPNGANVQTQGYKHSHDPIQFTATFPPSPEQLYYGHNEDETVISFTQPNWPTSGLDFIGGCVSAYAFILEGCANQCVVIQPRNYFDFVALVADNSVEASACEVQVLSGVGGPGAYFFPITTNLPNAQLLVFDTDTPGQPPGTASASGAGSESGTGAGGDGSAEAGAGGGDSGL